MKPRPAEAALPLGYKRIAGYERVGPPLPQKGKILGVRFWLGFILVMQESDQGPRLYALGASENSTWQQVMGPNA